MRGRWFMVTCAMASAPCIFRLIVYTRLPVNLQSHPAKSQATRLAGDTAIHSWTDECLLSPVEASPFLWIYSYVSFLLILSDVQVRNVCNTGQTLARRKHQIPEKCGCVGGRTREQEGSGTELPHWGMEQSGAGKPELRVVQPGTENQFQGTRGRLRALGGRLGRGGRPVFPVLSFC